MTRSTRRTFVTTALLAVAASAVAAAADVSYDMDRSLPFARYRTYAWTAGTRIGDPLNDGRIVEAVDRELAAKGLARGGPDAAPDLRVTYHLRLDDSVRVSASATGWGPYGAGGSRFGTARADRVVVGTLAVVLTDAATGRVAWRGHTSLDIDPRATPDRRERAIGKTVARLLKSVPAVR